MEWDRSLGALLAGTVSIAALHALIPSHWLAFAVVGRRQKWSVRRTLTVTALAGLGHILLTITLGMILAGAGKEVARKIPPVIEHAVSACLLIALGVYFVFSALRGSHAGHSHEAESLDEATSEVAHSGLSARLTQTPTIMGALVLGLTLSPCLDLLSVYLAAAARPWRILLLLSVVMAIVTLSMMVLLVGLTLRGLESLNLRWLERHEGEAIGVLLIALGILLFFLK